MNPSTFSADRIKRAAALIREGKLVAFPTETVYGLGADALNAAAVAKIFELKGRPSTSPLIVHVASVEMARELVTEWPAKAQELAERYWPGPLTLVLPKAAQIPDIVTAGLPTVGIRVPAHPIALKLIEEAGVPIAAPSANRFTQLSPTTAEHVRRAFGNALEILDGGPTDVGIESTVVSLLGGKLTLLRPGMISLGEIEQGTAPEAESHPAPGMHPRHYSPRNRLLVVDRAEELPDSTGAYVSLTRQTPADLEKHAACIVQMPDSPADYAACLYSVLHDLDQANWSWIAVELPPDTPEWAAIRDRLRRASN